RFPDDDAAVYTVGQVAEMLTVQPAFLRRLDSERVVSPRRSAGGQRRYSRHEIQHIDAIIILLADGVTLAGAKRILQLQGEVDALRQQLDDRDAAAPDT
ncbi:MAG: MerR family transcriptional regulator, partial [Ilumatobacteraceae bacterium]